MKNDTDRLWKHYDGVFRTLSKKCPKIMMSHFLPLEFEMPERYRSDPCSNFFISTEHLTSKIWMTEAFGWLGIRILQ